MSKNVKPSGGRALKLREGHALKIEYLATSALIPDPRNARKHPRRQIVRLTAVVAEFGFTNPILIDEGLHVLAGHARLEVAKELRMDQVPCLRLGHLSKDQKSALALADNKLADMSQFDPELLAAQLAELCAVDFALELTGFETAEIDLLLEVPTVGATDPADSFAESAPDAVAVSQLGDLWELGMHRLLCGNSLEEAAYVQVLGDRRADMVFADAPYNVPIRGHVSGLGKIKHREFAMACGEMTKAEFTIFLVTYMKHAAAFSVDGSMHFHCIDWRHLDEILEAGGKAYREFKALCVWDKGQGGMGSLYRSQHELILVYKNGTAPHVNNIELGRYGRYRTNIWRHPGLNSFGKGRDDNLAVHPTVKPVSLVADAFRDCSKRGALILDPFAGSGTILLAAERTGRKAAAIELDPIYVDTAVLRWQQNTGHTATLSTTGESFEAVAARRASSPPEIEPRIDDGETNDE
jgi:DNA modification methylase